MRGTYPWWPLVVTCMHHHSDFTRKSDSRLKSRGDSTQNHNTVSLGSNHSIGPAGLCFGCVELVLAWSETIVLCLQSSS